MTDTPSSVRTSRRFAHVIDLFPMEKQRDLGIDVLRGIALMRVFLWHATGYAFLTWVGALPVMMFITGMFLARSLRESGLVVIIERFRRLLVPFWVFGMFAWGLFVSVSAARGEQVRWSDLMWWMFPLSNPVAPDWTGGWMSEPLWYIRMLAWMFLLLPMIGWIGRRVPVVGAAVLSVAVFVVEWSLGVEWWAVQNVIMFAVFAVLGVAAGEKRLPKFGPKWGWLIPAGIAGSTLSLVLFGVPAGSVVNDSHSLHLSVGLYTLGLGGLAVAALRSFGGRQKALVQMVSARSLSFYLWHSAAIGLILVLMGGWLAWIGDNWISRAVLVLLSLPLTLFAVWVFGVFEDLSSTGKSKKKVEHPDGMREVSGRFALTGVVALLISSVALPWSPTGANSFELPPPSQAPESGNFSESFTFGEVAEPEEGVETVDVETVEEEVVAVEEAEAETEEVVEDVFVVRPVPAVEDLAEPISADRHQEFQQLLSEYSEKFGASTGALVIKPGVGYWHGKHGNITIEPDSELSLHSMSKMFTAALVWKAVHENLIDIDDKVGALKAAPWYEPSKELTWRQLLDYNAGLTNYPDTQESKDDRGSIDGWEAALRATQNAGYVFETGSMQQYSSTNYIVLGVAVAELYGITFEELLQQHLLDPLIMPGTAPGTPSPGSPATGTGGMTGTMNDLARFALGLFHFHSYLPEETVNRMMEINPDSMMGPGLFGYCPCGVDENDEKRWAGYGYHGVLVTTRYFPATGTVVVLAHDGWMWDEGQGEASAELTGTFAQML